ncbi:MAG TPA: hypothetical protein VHQ95_15705 [Pyrinomonadaceae bacterium]|jgi:hypothetical protein|nr:hypothetical protein [Pyrinomonadaceae bacterium]
MSFVDGVVVGKFSGLADNAANVVGRVRNQPSLGDLPFSLSCLELFCLRLDVFSS